MSFDYTSFVSDIRDAALKDDPENSTFEVLRSVLDDEELLTNGLPKQEEDEILLFEDDSVSIWSCKFDPEYIMPPHEHKMPVHIGVVSGYEKNILLQRKDNSLAYSETKIVSPGEILSLDETALHAVSAKGTSVSHALHVYLGPLTKVRRDLFDWATGQTIEFTMENFDRLKRLSKDFPEY